MSYQILKFGKHSVTKVPENDIYLIKLTNFCYRTYGLDFKAIEP